ncbi:phosphatase PAP2 family protein [Nocardioidaceae bacterium]|nr:phosphatase PAP2 family protein [Nocardioidaceae bacterium]
MSLLRAPRSPREPRASGLQRLDVAGEGDVRHEIVSGYMLAVFLGFVLAGFTALAAGPLVRIDTYFNLAPPPPEWRPVLQVVDRIGQRAVCLPILALVVLWCVRRTRSWRPMIVAGVSVFMLNLTVLILKIGLGRAAPATADPYFFQGGLGAYPSGHTSNIVLVYGLMAYLALRYGGVPRGRVWTLALAVTVLSVVMVGTSLTLNWHWFADLVAGLLVGGLVLELTATIDLHLAASGPRRLRDAELVRRVAAT